MLVLNTAQMLTMGLFDLHDGIVRDYKAPPAPRHPQPQPRYSRQARFATAWDNEGRATAYKPRGNKLFKGHRS